MKERANRSRDALRGIGIGLVTALVATVLGCVGYVDGGYGADVYVPGPDVVIFGGGFDHDRGREVHDYSHRGVESRRVAHPSFDRGGHR